MKTCQWGGRYSDETFEYFVNSISLMNFSNASPPTLAIRKRHRQIV